jgi:hypothetical protein
LREHTGKAMKKLPILQKYRQSACPDAVVDGACSNRLTPPEGRRARHAGTDCTPVPLHAFKTVRS